MLERAKSSLTRSASNLNPSASFRAKNTGEYTLTVKRSTYEVRAARCVHPGCRAWELRDRGATNPGVGAGRQSGTFAASDLLQLDSVLAFDPDQHSGRRGRSSRGSSGSSNQWPRGLRQYLAGAADLPGGGSGRRLAG